MPRLRQQTLLIRSAWSGFFLALMLQCSGCLYVNIPNYSFTPSEFPSIDKKFQGEFVKVSATIADEKDRTGKVRIVSQYDYGTGKREELFLSELERSLSASIRIVDLYLAGSDNRYEIHASVLESNAPVYASISESAVTIRYRIVREESARVVYVDTIRTTGIGAPDDSSIGSVRAAIAQNRAIQANVGEFLSRVGRVGIPSP